MYFKNFDFYTRYILVQQIILNVIKTLEGEGYFDSNSFQFNVDFVDSKSILIEMSIGDKTKDLVILAGSSAVYYENDKAAKDTKFLKTNTFEKYLLNLYRDYARREV